ncbi:MAG: hypothetical protein KatS3mg105_2221 [Gemmatales bacterium]|nr:MAG: hypothetical protein KatS3mg105_2221 [Gemmatales bacterium]
MTNFESLEFATAAEAIGFAATNRPVAIRLEGKNLVVRQEDAERLEAAGVSFAYLHEHEGRLVTVPVN